jgi:lysozyme
MTNAVDIAVPRLAREEAFKPFKYKDPRGHETIAYGFNIDAGISQYAALALLQAQSEERHIALGKFPWYATLDPPRQSVFVDLSFNDGIEGLLHFHKTITATAAANWQTAHDELLDSDAARELPSRYKPLAQIMLTGAV